MSLILSRLLYVVAVVLLGGQAALAQPRAGVPVLPTVRIAFVDPLSGPFAATGQNLLEHFQLVTEIVNDRQLAGPGIRFEIVPFDNKSSPQETLTVLKSVIDQGIRFVAQGNGSHVAMPLAEAIAKHNERNPAQSIVYLNYAAVDPDLTNGKCSFWHFRFDANTDMKMAALTEYMKSRPGIKSVYLINQNYSHGQQVARAARALIARQRPDIAIVGEDLHPLGQVRDFSPYMAKIRASGADTVITGNWGPDLVLLVRAARDAGLEVAFYTYYAGVTGVPTAIGAAGADRVHQVSSWHPNIAQYPGEGMYVDFKKRFKAEWFTLATYTSLTMLAEAIRRTGTTDPVRVAYAMAGLRMPSLVGEIEMRAADHQLQQPLFISVWTRAGGEVRHDSEDTGYGFKTVKAIDAAAAAQPTTCQMRRPARP